MLSQRTRQLPRADTTPMQLEIEKLHAQLFLPILSRVMQLDSSARPLLI